MKEGSETLDGQRTLLVFIGASCCCSYRESDGHGATLCSPHGSPRELQRNMPTAEPANCRADGHEGSGTADPTAAADLEKRKVSGLRIRAAQAAAAQELNPNFVLCQVSYPDTSKLLLRRQQSLGLNTATHMMNSLPLHVVRGEGCHLYSDQDVELLDCVNNVAHVGHCHPKVGMLQCPAPCFYAACNAD